MFTFKSLSDSSLPFFSQERGYNYAMNKILFAAKNNKKKTILVMSEPLFKGSYF